MAIHGPKINDLRERAKAVVMMHFVGLGEKDGVPPTLRAMYAIKVAQAQTYLAAYEAWLETKPGPDEVCPYQSLNRCIEKDAEQRNYTPFQMATIILYMASESLDLEDRRLAVNVEIENARDERAIKKILDDLGLSL
jgi:hypothetical protein